MGDEDNIFQNAWSSGTDDFGGFGGFVPVSGASGSSGIDSGGSPGTAPDMGSDYTDAGTGDSVLRQGGLFTDPAKQTPSYTPSGVGAPKDPLANLPSSLGRAPSFTANASPAEYRTDPLEPSPNPYVNLFEASSPGNTLMRSLVGTETPVPGQAKTGEAMINSYVASMGQAGGEGEGASADPLVTNTNGTSQGEDQQKSAEEQRRQWEFDKGIDSSLKRGRTWPSNGKINSDYELERPHPVYKGKVKPHQALDIKNSKGGPVVSAGDGTVRSVESSGSGDLGNHVVIDYDNGYRGVYGHTAPSVKPGQKVRSGEPIGNTDLSGATTGPHVHYEVRDPKTGQKLNPRDHLPMRLE
jgi:murein DD-endopeptidase MepM/ murein hydrolase activator NlpD